MESKDALKSLELKFTSSNKIPVERAVITRKEWESIHKMVNLVVPALRAVWADWKDSWNMVNPDLEGYETLQLIKKAIEAIGAEAATDAKKEGAE